MKKKNLITGRLINFNYILPTKLLGNVLNGIAFPNTAFINGYSKPTFDSIYTYKLIEAILQGFFRNYSCFKIVRTS